MSEFERSDQSGAWADARELQFPEDFSSEEAAFAKDLRDFFAIDGEVLPPLYVQTLLQDEQFPILDAGFEQRITNQVFGSLRLDPPPPQHVADAPHPTSVQRLSAQTHPYRSRRPTVPERLWTLLHGSFVDVNRSLAMGAGVFLLFMVLAVVLATPSFAQGVRIILGNTGVVQVKAPTTAPTSGRRNDQKNSGIPDPEPQFDPQMPLFWLGPVAGNYAYEGTQLQHPTIWSDGAIVNVHYGFQGSGAGSGTLDIREFQVSPSYSAVLQVVEPGYATSVSLSDGEQAVYVNGMWQQSFLDHTLVSTWQTGTNCMLIMERQGVVIWMAGDPRDGLNAQSMVSIASQLVTVSRTSLMRNYRGVWLASASLVVSVNDPLGSEWYLLVSASISPATGAGQFVFSGTSTGSGPYPGS